MDADPFLSIVNRPVRFRYGSSRAPDRNADDPPWIDQKKPGNVQKWEVLNG